MLEQICLYWGTGEDAVGNADCYRKKENIHLIQILVRGVRGDEVWNISITLEVATEERRIHTKVPVEVKILEGK